MAIDWEKFERAASRAAKRADKKTDQKLATGLAAATHLTDEEIQKLFPKPADAEKLAELLRIVKGAENYNTRVANLKDRIDDLSGVIIKLLGKTI